MLAAILAGGKGTRMDILCQVRPKSAESVRKVFVKDYFPNEVVQPQLQDSNQIRMPA